jgi:hypothetical protein
MLVAASHVSPKTVSWEFPPETYGLLIVEVALTGDWAFNGSETKDELIPINYYA